MFEKSPTPGPPPPPPPIPPPSLVSERDFSMSTVMGEKIEDSPKKKPFLRKGSRTEPSSLNRKPLTKSTKQNFNAKVPPSVEERRLDTDKNTAFNLKQTCDIVECLFLDDKSIECERKPRKTYDENRNDVDTNTKYNEDTTELSTHKCSNMLPLHEQNYENKENDIVQSDLTQLKRMKRRQEAALLEAERIRELARSWANNERERVDSWVSEQRASIDKLRKQAKQDQLLSQKSRYDRHEKKKKEMEIEAMKATVVKCKLDGEERTKRLKANERRLLQRIRKQEEKIQMLERKQQAIDAPCPYCQDREEQKRFVTDKMDQSVQTSFDVYSMGLSEMSTQSIMNRGALSEDIESCPHSKLNVPEKEDDFTLKITHESRPKIFTKKNYGPINLSTVDWDKIDEGMRGRHYAEAHHGEETKLWLRGGINMEENDEPVSTVKLSTDLKYEQECSSPNGSMLPAESSKMSCTKNNNTKPIVVNKVADKTEHTFPDGRRTILYKNGTYKEIAANGNTHTIRYTNGDVMTKFIDRNIVVYYYASSNVSAITIFL